MRLSETTIVSNTRDWVLESCLNAWDDVLAIALSSSVIKFYDATSLRQVGSTVSLAPQGAPPESQRVCATRWDTSSPFLYYVACGSSDIWDAGIGQSSVPLRQAKVHAFDTRSNTMAHQWDFGPLARDVGELGAMDISTTGTILCLGLGSEVCFFDVRGRNQGGREGGRAPLLLDRYSSHSDAVTSLMWHPFLPRHTLSASEDGLVNVYDSGIAGEEDALVSTLNVGDSLSHFGVFGPSGALVHCATRTGELSVWNIGGAEKLAEFVGLRGVGSQAPQPGPGDTPHLDYLLSAHYHPSRDTLTALGAENNGNIHVLDVTLQGCGVKGVLKGGHTASPRCAAMPIRDPGVVYTGGEDGRVCTWREGSGSGRDAKMEGSRGKQAPSSRPWDDEAALFGKTKVSRR